MLGQIVLTYISNNSIREEPSFSHWWEGQFCPLNSISWEVKLKKVSILEHFKIHLYYCSSN